MSFQKPLQLTIFHRFHKVFRQLLKPLKWVLVACEWTSSFHKYRQILVGIFIKAASIFLIFSLAEKKKGKTISSPAESTDILGDLKGKTKQKASAL
jgi:hypothetical protein